MRQQTIQSNKQGREKPRGSARKGPETRRQGRTSRLALAPSPSLTPVSSLIIPTIPKSIPRELRITSASAKAAKIVLSLLELGLVSEEDVLDGNAPHEVIASSFKRWMDQRNGDFKGHFELYLTLLDTLDEMGMSNKDLENVDVGEAIPAHGLKVAIEFRNAGFYTLKDKVEALEAAVPGLGEHALCILYAALHQTQFAVTPLWALDMARYEYWQGEDDEKSVLEEFEMNEEEYDGLTRALFDEQIPKKGSEPGLTLDAKNIGRIAKEKPQFVDLCTLLLEGEAIKKEYSSFIRTENILNENGDCNNVEYACLLCWQDGDPVCRILDDWGNYQMQMGTTSVTGFYFSHDTTAGIADLLRRIEVFLKYLSFGAKLLGLLGTREDG